MEYRLADSRDTNRLAEPHWAHKNEDAPLGEGDKCNGV